MNDPIAMPVYSALLGYLIGVLGPLVSSRRSAILAFGVAGLVLAAISFVAFGRMSYVLHVGMGGEPSLLLILIGTVVGLVLLLPIWLVLSFRLRATRSGVRR